MTDDNVYSASVGALLSNLRFALVSLLPAAKVALLTWTDDDQHRDWENLAEAAFNTFVRGPIDAAMDRAATEFPLARYDIDRDDYSGVSWISPAEDCPGLALVRFRTISEPFDHLEVVEVESGTLVTGLRSTVPWHEGEYCLVRRGPEGLIGVVEKIDANDQIRLNRIENQVHGLAEDADLSFLGGERVQQVCIGENEIIFRFDEISITIESSFLVSIDGVEAMFEDAPASAEQSVALLGEQIVGTRVVSGGTLVVEFSGGKRLEMFDSSPDFESYQISSASRTIVV